nr:PREDICTED: archaemetzincin-1 [Apteryx mantelli mantelli]
MLQCKHAQEFSFGPRALKDALISTNPALQELYAKAFSSAEKLFLSEAYNPQRTLFCTLLIRTAFDWLLSYPDAPEDFETFYHSMLRRKQNFYRKHIYLQPIDLIEGPAGLSLLDSLQSCVESFFLGLRVKCLPSIPVSSIHCCYRHSQDSDRVQLHAGFSDKPWERHPCFLFFSKTKPFLLSSQKLYAWTQTVLSGWPRQESAELSASEDLLPFSSDSGMCCENDSEAVTSLSEPLTPDTCSQALSIGQELEQDECSCLPAEARSQPQLATRPVDSIREYELWLETCIAALERNVSEEELAQVDKTVDALAKWEMFTGQLPAMKKDLPFARDNTGLRKVLGDKFSSLRRKLSARKLSKGESSPHRWRWEEN